MSSEGQQLIVYPGAIIDYQEKVTFTVPASNYPTQVDVKLFYDKNKKEFRAVCYQTSVVRPERRIRGIAALLEDSVPVVQNSKEDSLVVGRVVPQKRDTPVLSRRAVEATRREAGRATCKPLKRCKKNNRRSFAARNQTGARKPEESQKTAEVPASQKRTGGQERESGVFKRLCLGLHKETLKKTNTSTLEGDRKKTVLQRVETETTTRNIIKDVKTGKPVFDKHLKEVLKKVEVSEKVIFQK